MPRARARAASPTRWSELSIRMARATASPASPGAPSGASALQPRHELEAVQVGHLLVEQEQVVGGAGGAGGAQGGQAGLPPSASVTTAP